MKDKIFTIQVPSRVCNIRSIYEAILILDVH